ncbi:helix-turn-helix domain-containing protein [bacterium]|nr:helix-turn-helix domain-containing protein [bacterium]
MEDFKLATCSNEKTLKDLRNRVQYRPDEAADVMGVSVSKMKTWIKTGVLPSYTIDDMRFVMKSDLLAFIESHRSQAFGLAS